MFLFNCVQCVHQVADVFDLGGTLALLLTALLADHLLLGGLVVAHLRVSRLATVLAIVHHGNLVLQHLLFR